MNPETSARQESILPTELSEYIPYGMGERSQEKRRHYRSCEKVKRSQLYNASQHVTFVFIIVSHIVKPRLLSCALSLRRIFRTRVGLHAMTTDVTFAPNKSRAISRGVSRRPLTYLPGTSVEKKITRPIALVTIASTIFEMILLDVMEPFIVTCDNQFGFKKKHSTEHCIYALIFFISYYNWFGSPVYTWFF